MSCNLEPALKYWGDTKEIAKALDIDNMTVRNWIARDRLPLNRALQMVKLSNGKVKLKVLIPELKGVK
jgi:hypothetical protein